MIFKISRVFGLVLSVNYLLLSNLHASFEDVDTTHPYFYGISKLENLGILQGYKTKNGDYFKPLNKLNRAEALKILMVAGKIPKVEDLGKIKKFSDVKANVWYTGYIDAAVNKEIIKGYLDGTFKPGNLVNRAEFIKMAILVFEVPQIKSKTIPKDAKWYDIYFDTANTFRLFPQSKAAPEGIISRGEAAEIIYRILKVKEGEFKYAYVHSGFGKASYYNEGFAGKLTANGETYDPYDLTAAHRTLPFGTRLKVYNKDGDFVIVRVNDRGPYHSSRVLDLSEKAFKTLAPISRGVLDIEFEIFSDVSDPIIKIPEVVRPVLTPDVKNDELPQYIQANLSKTDPDFKEKIGKKKVINKNSFKNFQPLFNRQEAQYSVDFFENFKMRRRLDSKVALGTVMNFSGRVNNQRYKKVTVFLENKATGKQQHYKTSVSGKNFSLALPFYEKGEFKLGVVFDQNKRSKIATITVCDEDKRRLFPALDIKYNSELNLNVIPDNEEVKVAWNVGVTEISKMIFSQGKNRKYLIFEHGINSFNIPYDFFKNFKVDETLAIDFYLAESYDGSYLKQKSNWKKVDFANFLLKSGFPDREVEEISIKKFSRYLHKLTTVKILGKLLSSNIRVADKAYVIEPTGFVKELVVKKSGNNFIVEFKPTHWGSHVIEIVSTEGQILFNRGVYFYRGHILPVKPWFQTKVRYATRESSLTWINNLRVKHGIAAVYKNDRLNHIAQDYAEEMAQNNFISHTNLDGENLEARLAIYGVEGEFGENLSYGTSFELALHGLENSASHRKNMLKAKWKKVGIGIAQNTKGDYYTVHLFQK
jgi:rare lipoprotein A